MRSSPTPILASRNGWASTRNTPRYGLILPSRRNLRLMPKSGRGYRTRHNISHQILATATNPKLTCDRAIAASLNSRPVGLAPDILLNFDPSRLEIADQVRKHRWEIPSP